MITVTRLGGGTMVVNADLIVSIEQTPDTVVVLMNGDKLFVREVPELLVHRVVDYRHRLARLEPAAPDDSADRHGA